MVCSFRSPSAAENAARCRVATLQWSFVAMHSHAGNTARYLDRNGCIERIYYSNDVRWVPDEFGARVNVHGNLRPPSAWKMPCEHVKVCPSMMEATRALAAASLSRCFSPPRLFIALTFHFRDFCAHHRNSRFRMGHLHFSSPRLALPHLALSALQKEPRLAKLHCGG